MFFTCASPTNMAFISTPFATRSLNVKQQRQRQRRHCCRCSVAADADVVVVGDGVGGLAAARALKRVGREVVVLEREQQDASTGQAVGLWTNAWRALEALQVDMTELRGNIRNTTAQIVRASDGRRLAKFDIPQTTEFRYVEREQLVRALRHGLDDVRYGTAVDNVAVNDGHSGTSKVVIDDGGEVIRARLVIGADGIRSVVRESLGLSNTVRNASYHAWRGSAVVKPDEMAMLSNGEILQAWGVSERVGMTRVRDDLLHWFYTETKLDDDKFGSDAEELEYVRQRVKLWGCDAVREAVSLPQRAFTLTRCGDRLMLPVVYGKGGVTLVGDAAHLSTPNLGQGAALALEDAVELAYRLSVGVDDAGALRAYERARWARNLSVGLRSGAAGVVALRNFVTLKQRSTITQKSPGYGDQKSYDFYN